ncbi:MAG: sialidase family protein, partial [Patescibacteria group bacterium]|nr:sialidase family protein [Patescibacteria group bacterium]
MMRLRACLMLIAMVAVDVHLSGPMTVFAAEVVSDAGVERIRLLPPGEGNPRNSEGDFIALKDGRILFVYSHFTGGGSDHAAAHLAGRYSSDGGRTWTKEDVVIVPREGGFNVMSVSLLRLQDGRIALFYLRKNSLVDCRPMMRVSRDEGQTWSEPVLCIDEVGYNVLNNDRAVQLSNGRIILPVALHNTPAQDKFDGRGIISCHFSDDQGRTWRQSKTVQQGDKLTLQEPGLVQLKDGRLMMFCRTTHGSQYVSYSTDWGDTWSPFEPSNIISPCSPATIERIPSTGDLLLVWNDHARIDDSLRGKRTPLNVAISTDEGQTWKNVKTLEDDRNGWYCYIAADVVGDHVLLGHCAGDRRTGGLNATQITRLPVAWLYEPAEAFSLGDGLRERCVGILKQGIAGMRADMPKDDFWPAIHAAEGLALSGHGDVVIETLTPLLASETDAQKRCGLA